MSVQQNRIKTQQTHSNIYFEPALFFCSRKHVVYFFLLHFEFEFVHGIFPQCFFCHNDTDQWPVWWLVSVVAEVIASTMIQCYSSDRNNKTELSAQKIFIEKCLRVFFTLNSPNAFTKQSSAQSLKCRFSCAASPIKWICFVFSLSTVCLFKKYLGLLQLARTQLAYCTFHLRMGFLCLQHHQPYISKSVTYTKTQSTFIYSNHTEHTGVDIHLQSYVNSY